MVRRSAKQPSSGDTDKSAKAEDVDIDVDDSAIEPADGPIAKAFQLLQVLADAPSGGIGVRAISRELDLPVSSVHRLLGVLVGAGMASRDVITRQYAIGLEAYRIAARITRGMKLSELAMPALRKLAGEFNETVLLGVYLEQSGQMMFSERVDGTQALQYRIAMLTPLSLVWGASGKAILAYLDPELVEETRRREGAAPASGAVVPSKSTLASQLKTIRRNGFAVSEGEKLPGACGVAAPLFGRAGVVGCICLTSPIDRLSYTGIHAITERIAQEANYVSELYGGEVPESGVLRRDSV
jgi:DNA-binding IclR family transcriptional regulator